MKQFSTTLHTASIVLGKKPSTVLLLLFLLVSFFTTNGQTNPTVTINQAVLQNDPTTLGAINFTVVFDQPVGGFASGDVIITGTAGATVALVTGGPSLYNVTVSGMISCGTVTVNIPAAVCVNSLLEPNLASTSIDNTVTLLTGNPNVTINQAAAQTDPTTASPINFTVQFDQLVTGFGTGDVSLSGTAGATTAIVTGSGDRYNVAVSGMTSAGTVIASIAAGVCTNNCSLSNNASTSTDNTVTISCVPPVVNVTPAVSCGGVVTTGCVGPLTASGNADNYTWSSPVGLFTNCSLTAPYAGDNRTVLYAAPTANTLYTVTGTITATGCSAKATAQVNYTTPPPLVTPASVTMCIGDAPVKLKVLPGSIPASPAIWSPGAGLFRDAAATVPYIAGTPADSVWTRPTPAGTYTYQVTTQSVPNLLCSPGTNFFQGSNGDGMITFNVKNNHPFPIRLFQINSKTRTAVQTFVMVYYKTSGINGPPGVIAASNGWIQFGGNSIAGTGALQPFITNLQLTIPAGATYGICLQATTGASAPNLAYTTLAAGNYSFNDGGCELITGTNIGYSGSTNTPSTPLSGFMGSVQFADAGATCTSPPGSVTVTVGGAPATITSQPANQTFCNAGGVAVFSVGVNNGIAYQWQLSINGGASWNNITNAAPYSGINTATLTINPVSIAMNGYLYRLAIYNCSGNIIYSNAALLSFNPIPSVTITANPVVIGPTQTSTISSTVFPNPATSYAWYYNSALIPGATNPSLLVNYGSPGDYQLKVTDVNNCGVGVSNIVTIANSFASFKYVYPNPAGGIFQVRHPLEPNTPAQRTINVFNNQGILLLSKTVTQSYPYQAFDVDISQYGPGMYWVEWRVAGGGRLAMSKVVVDR